MATFPPAVHDVFRFDELLSPEERAIRRRVRGFMVRRAGGPLAAVPHIQAHA
jgi:hypothetical protein